MSGLLITGTDTDSGKTLVSLGLMAALQKQGHSVNGFKPVAAGSRIHQGQKVNDDALLLLQQASDSSLEYSQVNPYLFDEPVAPHLAAQRESTEIALEVLRKAYLEIAANSDWIIVEGAGGWLVPLNPEYSVADLAIELDLPVIVVVGLKLGCINHARLTVESVLARGCKLIGWVGSQLDRDMLYLDDNIQTLKHYLPAPCLGIVPYLQNPTAESVAKCIDTSGILK